MAAPRNHIKVFVASTVYNFQTELNQIYDLLDEFGYDVLNSHIGSVPLDSSKSNLNICLDGVNECDVFIGFIRPDYGSGITHDEFRTAYNREIPRFILADYRVVFTRSLLKNAVLMDSSRSMKMDSGNVDFRDKNIMDIRCIQMYEEMIKDKVKPYSSRIGHWVQEYVNLNDIKLHLEAQFKYPVRIQGLIDKIARL